MAEKTFLCCDAYGTANRVRKVTITVAAYDAEDDKTRAVLVKLDLSRRGIERLANAIGRASVPANSDAGEWELVADEIAELLIGESPKGPSLFEEEDQSTPDMPRAPRVPFVHVLQQTKSAESAATTDISSAAVAAPSPTQSTASTTPTPAKTAPETGTPNSAPEPPSTNHKESKR